MSANKRTDVLPDQKVWVLSSANKKFIFETNKGMQIDGVDKQFYEGVVVTVKTKHVCVKRKNELRLSSLPDTGIPIENENVFTERQYKHFLYNYNQGSRVLAKLQKLLDNHTEIDPFGAKIRAIEAILLI